MANTSKAKGSAHERDVCRYLNAHGFPHAERMPAGATLDRGDLAGVIDRDGDRWTVEVKRQRDQSNGNIASWCREAAAEAENGGTLGWIVVGKKWGSAEVGDSPVWLPLMMLNLTGDRTYEHLHYEVAQITLRAWCLLTGEIASEDAA
jgi:hypothetical protein